MAISAALAMSLACGFPVQADVEQRRLIGAEEVAQWRGVGSLRVSGRRSCTAVLISPTEALTAAHCVVDRETGRKVPAATFVLVLGQPEGNYSAVRGVSRTAFLPGFMTSASTDAFSIMAMDLALLELDEPVTLAEAEPFTVTGWLEPIGDLVDIVGYERDGPKAATIRKGCVAVETDEAVAALACDVITGLSGAPVVQPGNPGDPALGVVAIVSARLGGSALVVQVAPRLANLRALIAK
jgi:protease YdgD